MAQKESHMPINLNVSYRKFKDKFVLYKLHSIAKEINTPQYTYKTTHWVTWDQFEQIHRILDDIIYENFSKHKKSSHSEPQLISRYLANTRIRLVVTIEKRENDLFKLLELEEGLVHKLQMTVKVTDECCSPNYKITETTANIEVNTEDIYTPKSAETLSTSSSTISPPYKPNPKTKEKPYQHSQEYVPKGSPSAMEKATQSRYVPSKIGDTSDPNVEDEYLPEVVTVMDSSQNTDSEVEHIMKRPKKYTPQTIVRKSARVRRGNDEEETDENGLIALDNAMIRSTPISSRKRLQDPHSEKQDVLSISDSELLLPSTKSGDTPVSKRSRVAKKISSDDSLSDADVLNKNKPKSEFSMSVELFGAESSNSDTEKPDEKIFDNLCEKYNVKSDNEEQVVGGGSLENDLKSVGSKSTKKTEKENKSDGQRTIDGWLTKDSVVAKKKEELVPVKKSTASSSTKREPKIKIYKHAKPKKKDREVSQKLEEERLKMAMTRKQLDDLNSNMNMNVTQEPVEVLNCKNLNMEILKSFHEVEDRLTELMEQYKDYSGSFNKIKIFRNLTPEDITAHCSIDQTYEMVMAIEKNFNKSSDAGRFDSLFTELLLPEWIVQVFMKLYNFQRTEALEYMYRQRNSLTVVDMNMSQI